MTLSKDQGRAGGLAGGPARAAKLSPERRSEIARMGALATNAKRKKALDEAALIAQGSCGTGDDEPLAPQGADNAIAPAIQPLVERKD